MIGAMDRVGKAIRDAYHWVEREQKCFLVMDNAGGHGTKAAIQQYEMHLRKEYNIHIIWQVPRLPYTNVLDLGIWMSLQAQVEREHYLKRCTVDELVHSIETIWRSSDLNNVMTNVFNKLRVVFCNILKANGGNDLVEDNRGAKKRNVKLEDVLKDIERENMTDHDETVDLQNFDGFTDEEEGGAQIMLV